MEAGAEVLPKARAGDVTREDGGRCACECRLGVVVAAGRAEKMKMSRTPIAATWGGRVTGNGATGLRLASCNGSRTW